DVGLAILSAVLATAAGAAAERWVGLSDLSMVFIVAVVLVASKTRMAAAVLAAALCFLSYNFFFIAPRFTFYIGARQGVATVFLFLAAALVAGRLASRLRTQVLALRAANAHATALQALSRRLAVAADLGQVVDAGRRALKQATDADALVQAGDAPLGDNDGQLTDKDRAAADWSRKHGQAAGRFTDTLGNAAWWFMPLRGDSGPIGLLGLRFPESTT